MPIPNWSKNFYNPVRNIMTDLRQFMDLYERETIYFIFARTGTFNKQWEFISNSQFMRGVFNTRTGELVLPPVAISKTKLLSSLRHLEGKGFIEVRHGDIRTSNEYRIRGGDEINLDHVAYYIDRNQPELCEEIRNLYGKFDQRITFRERVARSTSGHRLVPPMDQGVGPPVDHRNIQIDNKTNSKVAQPSAGAKLRKVQVGNK